ncbi:MAG: sirohydrochlorin chelatase [Pirellulaceae bacterium]
MISLRASSGLLVVGHGTHDDQGQRDFWVTLRQIAEELPDSVVEGCFLEGAAPDIATGLEEMARQGVRDVVVVPLLLFSAGHALHDIPALVASAATRTGIRVRQAEVLGCHPLILRLSAERFWAAVGSDYWPQSVLLLFVGRGSRDLAATAEVQRFVAQRVALTPVGRIVVAFLAMAEPRVEEVVAEITASEFERVVVQPHLLYPGALLSRLRSLVEMQERAPDRQPGRQQWILADCLGCDRAVARAVVDRFLQSARETDEGSA